MKIDIYYQDESPGLTWSATKKFEGQILLINEYEEGDTHE